MFFSKQADSKLSVKNNLQAPARMHCGKEGAGRGFYQAPVSFGGLEAGKFMGLETVYNKISECHFQDDRTA